MTLTEIIFRVLGRLAPMLWYAHGLGYFLRVAVRMIDDEASLQWLADWPDERARTEAMAAGSEHVLDIVIGLRTRELLGLAIPAGPAFAASPAFLPPPASTGCCCRRCCCRWRCAWPASSRSPTTPGAWRSAAPRASGARGMPHLSCLLPTIGRPTLRLPSLPSLLPCFSAHSLAQRAPTASRYP